MYAEFQLHTLYYFDAERVKREHLIIYQTRVFHKVKRVHPLFLQKRACFRYKSRRHSTNAPQPTGKTCTQPTLWHLRQGKRARMPIAQVRNKFRQKAA